jgi:hypothetical protein
VANWAVVIGVDEYWTPKACLRGAVRDALKMRDWLLSAGGGNVPPENLILLLSPVAGGAQVDITDLPDHGELTPATRDQIVLALDDLLAGSGGQGQRLFFYFSGHGATARIDFSNQDSIVPTDFTPRLTSKAIPLRSIFEYFQASQFKEQFFFVDACRNIPWEKEEREFRVGPLDVPRRPEPPVPPQFIMYATAPLLRALERRQPGDERGVFTQALLAGLEGEGQAKVWDDAAEEYVVHWDRLFQYVDERVCDLLGRQRAVEEGEEPELGGRDTRSRRGAGGRWPQRPRQAGERGSENPALSHFGQRAFPAEPLDVGIEPEEALDQAEIVVGDLGGEIEHRSEIEALPVRFLLPPKTYSVRARAGAYRPEKRFYPIDLYGPAALEVRLLVEVRSGTMGFGGGLGELSPTTRRGLYLHGEAATEALATARAIADDRHRIGALARLALNLPASLRTEALEEALVAVRAIGDEGEQAQTLTLLWHYLPARLRDEALGMARAIRDEGHRAEALAEMGPKPGSVNLAAPDPLARIELADGAGRRLAAGEGSLGVDDLAPGFYRARLVTPEGRFTEELVELPDGGRASAQLEAPVPPDSRLFREVVARAGLEVTAHNTLRFESAPGPEPGFAFLRPSVLSLDDTDAGPALANAQLSTLLALAGGAANEPGDAGAQELGQVGIRAFRELVGEPADSGLQILLGVETVEEREARAFLTLGGARVETPEVTDLLMHTRLRCWVQGEAVPDQSSTPLSVPDLLGLGQFAWARPPGAYWLTIETPGQRPVAFATAVLPGRLTLVVLTRSAEGEVNLYQYLPYLGPVGGDDARAALDMLSGARFPMLQPQGLFEQRGARFPMLRRSELMQRTRARGRLDETSQNVLDLLSARWFEPVAACLGGHMTLRLDPGGESLHSAIDDLTRDFGGLADTHVLHAARQEARGSGDPRAAYVAALEVGVPLLAESLSLLQEGIARHGIEHEGVPLVQRVSVRRVPGLLWTAIPLEELGL